MKKKIFFLIGILIVIVAYIASLFFISSYQKKYHANLYSVQDLYSISVEDGDELVQYPITIENGTNKCLSTQLGYHLIYTIKDTESKVVYSDTPKSDIPNVYPDKIVEVNMSFYIPDKVGTYEIVVDIETSDGEKLSETGLVPATFTVEVY